MLMALPVAPRADTFEEKAQLCSACHGENGMPPDKSTPIIWGQHQGYLYLQLRDYKRGTRKDDVMSPVVDLLKSDDMMALAEYYSHKRWPDLRQTPAPPAVAARALEVNGSVGAPAVTFPNTRAMEPSRDLPARPGTRSPSQCSTSATAPAATIPACPIS
jgi:cytochrome c553